MIDIIYTGVLMPNHSVEVVSENTAYDFAWRSLRKFHDVSLTTDRVMKLRDIPAKHSENVEKQMRQLSYCLTQAHDFSRASRSANPTTRALQAYYSVTALANAEILWLGSGEDSIDRRPNTSHRHGFDLAPVRDIALCSAIPLVGKTGELQGLFGLWRKYATHFPHYGWTESHFPNGSSTSGLRQLSGVNRF